MARTRHRRRRHRNPSRNQWIAIGVGTAIVVAGGTILIVRHRRKALGTGGGTTGTTQGSGAPTGGIGHKQFQSQLTWLCEQPASLPFDAQQALINGIFIPTLNRELAKLSAHPTIPQIDAAIAATADSVVNQTCQPVTLAARAKALQLAQGAWAKTGLAGQ